MWIVIRRIIALGAGLLLAAALGCTDDEPEIQTEAGHLTEAGGDLHVDRGKDGPVPQKDVAGLDADGPRTDRDITPPPPVKGLSVSGHLSSVYSGPTGAMQSGSYRVRGEFTHFVSSTGTPTLKGGMYAVTGGVL